MEELAFKLAKMKPHKKWLDQTCAVLHASKYYLKHEFKQLVASTSDQCKFHCVKVCISYVIMLIEIGG